MKAIQEGIAIYELSKIKIEKSKKVLIRKLLPPFTKAIKKTQFLCNKKSQGRPQKYCEYLKLLSADKLAFITLYQAFLAYDDMNYSLTGIVLDIGAMVEKEYFLTYLFKEFPKKKKSIEHFVRFSDRELIISHKEYGRYYPNCGPEIKAHLGEKLTQLLIDSTGAFQFEKSDSSGKTINYLQVSESTINFLKDNQVRFGKLASPAYKPMICKPLAWKAIDRGGYLLIRTSLIKNLKKEHKKFLEKTNLSYVYKALNLIQSTPWQINRNIYNVAVQCIEQNIHLKTCKQESFEMSKISIDFETNKDSRKRWYCEKRKIQILRSNDIQIKKVLEIARDFIDDRNRIRIYFPHCLDWRGRVYPLPKSLNPQGNDVARSLLEFADGKPLGKYGSFWLGVHLANLFGIDKCSFKERLEWVKSNEDKIIDSAEKPLKGEKFWTTAKKPWSALAACFEWRGYIEKGNKWISHIPISMDGTCNGLQHYSAIGRDPIGGKATNLINCKTPQDIYLEVLNILNKELEKDIHKNIDAAKNWNGHLDREIVKAAVMTTPYGVTEYGLKEQIIKILLERETEERKMSGSMGINVNYLAQKLKSAIGEVVKAAPIYMKWLQSVAREFARKNIPIVWKTPIGFTVYQAYKPQSKKELRTSKHRITLYIENSQEKLSSNRNTQSLPPNFIHSLDSSHLMLTVMEAFEHYGISSFTMVHDSYGVHAYNCEDFSQVIRNTFSKMYRKDILGEFRQNLLSLSPDIKLDNVPKTGNLDINQVRISKYFFS